VALFRHPRYDLLRASASDWPKKEETRMAKRTLKTDRDLLRHLHRRGSKEPGRS